MHLSACHDEARKRITWLQKIDGHAYTNNATVHRELKAQYMVYYKASSQSTGLDSLQRKLDLKPYNPNGAMEATSEYSYVLLVVAPDFVNSAV